MLTRQRLPNTAFFIVTMPRLDRKRLRGAADALLPLPCFGAREEGPDDEEGEEGGKEESERDDEGGWFHCSCGGGM